MEVISKQVVFNNYSEAADFVEKNNGVICKMDFNKHEFVVVYKDKKENSDR